MREKLKEQLFAAMMRFKKIESAFGAECEMQMNEMAILQRIAGGCRCGEYTRVNLNVPEIQEKLQISKPAVSYILNTLEKKEYITREIDAVDRRKISIQATAKGMAAADQAERKYEDMWSKLLMEFGEEDMAQLIRLLKRMSDFCEGCSGEADQD